MAGADKPPPLPYLLVRVILISAPIGALIGFVLGGAEMDADTPRSLVSGAIIAIFAATAGILTEYWFHDTLERLKPGLARAARALVYILAGSFGYLIGGGLARVVLWDAPFFPPAGRAITYPLVISSVIAMFIGLAFFTYERMSGRLRESVELLKEQEFAGKELELARSIQKRLLPPTELEGDTYRVAARNMAARFVAGDFYDFFRNDDGSMGLVVADVAGKGIGASLIMASAKAILPLVADGRTVPETMRVLNAKLCVDLSKREFVALAYVRYDPASGRAEIANAGLPDPYLIRNGIAEPISVPGTRLPLGAMKAMRYESRTVTLAPGERLLLFTDGLPEASTGTGEMLGYDALASIVLLKADDPGEWLDLIFAKIHASGTGIDDDCTALVLERRA
jgi:hypothetical protein